MLQIYRKYFLSFLILVYVSGAIGFVLNPDFFLPFTPFTLLYTSFVFLIYQPIHNLKYVISFIAVAIIGFVSEVIGVKTGMIFGNYTYGSTLGFKFLEVPLTISLNWALLASACILISSYISSNRMVISIITALMATAIDFLIEQVAPGLDFWKFAGGIAGWHNYLGWLLVSFIAAFLFVPILKTGNKKIALIIIALQVLFFLYIYLIP